jgi:hypothetical protein
MKLRHNEHFSADLNFTYHSLCIIQLWEADDELSVFLFV